MWLSRLTVTHQMRNAPEDNFLRRVRKISFTVVRCAGPINTRRAATDRFGHEAILVLHIRNEAEPLVIEIGDGNNAVGRMDSATGRKVDIDLTRYGALQKGVSRLHAVFFRGEDDTLYLVDAGSSNGTFLNGHQLPANEASPVNNGDEITLGKLRMHAYFERRAVTTNL